MGDYSFKSEPEHCEVYRRMFTDEAFDLFGFTDGWNMPLAYHKRRLDEGSYFDGVPHFVATYQSSSGYVSRRDMAGGEARRGTISLQIPGSGGEFVTKGQIEYWHFYFKTGLIAEVCSELGSGIEATMQDFFGRLIPDVERDIQNYIQRATDAEDPPLALEMDGRAYLIVAGLVRSARASAGERFDFVSTSTAFDIPKVTQMIEDRLSEPLRLTDLAQQANMSPFHFARSFKSATGRTPIAYLQERRTKRAIELIQKSQLSLAEIAFNCGFSSQSHMGRAVKAATGKSPRSLRVLTS